MLIRLKKTNGDTVVVNTRNIVEILSIYQSTSLVIMVNGHEHNVDGTPDEILKMAEPPIEIAGGRISNSSFVDVREGA